MTHLATLVMVLSAPLAAPAAENADTRVGMQVADFELEDYLGTAHSLAGWADKKAIVIVFLGTECPLAAQYGPRLAELAAKYEPQGVHFAAIDSNRQDSLSEMAHYAKKHGMAFPFLKDPGNTVADRMRAIRTPEAFVLDSQRVVRYWGRIDDQYGTGYARGAASEHFVAQAIDALLAGQPVTTPESPPLGCHIGRLQRKPPTGEITWSKHVAPVFHHRCAQCHREGQIAPFALTEYEEVIGWTDTIREVLAEGRMPPWHASPAHGVFQNDQHMPDDEKSLVHRWIDGGAPEGDPAERPALAPFVDGWRIGKPDAIYRMPEPFTVPAQGVVQYQYFMLDPGFTEDKWLAAAEAHPGNRAVTHHLILFFHPPGDDRIEPGEALFNSLGAFAPGLPPAVYQEGYSRRIPAGSKLVIQAHYTPNGTEQTDQSEIGLIFADAASVKKEIKVAAALNWQFQIPPQAGDHRVEASYTADEDLLLYSLTPHMHLRGKSFRFEARYPDGGSEILLDVPRYDFNWQNYYMLAEPKRLPQGTVVQCSAAFDNSDENLLNPDPQATVTWGDQTWEEMMVGTLAVSPADQDLSLGLPKATPLEGEMFEVQFVYRPSQAVETVYLSGSFNEWQPTAHRMEGPDSEGKFTTRLTLSRGDHEYKFVENGETWRADPANPQHSGFYKNSLLRLGPLSAD